MTYRLQTSIPSARIESELGTFRIRDNVIEVEDEDLAEALYNHYGHVYRMSEVDDEDVDEVEVESEAEVDASADDGVDDDSEDAEGSENADDEVCGTLKSDGEPCERPAAECPYH